MSLKLAHTLKTAVVTIMSKHLTILQIILTITGMLLTFTGIACEFHNGYGDAPWSHWNKNATYSPMNRTTQHHPRTNEMDLLVSTPSVLTVPHNQTKKIKVRYQTSTGNDKTQVEIKLDTGNKLSMKSHSIVSLAGTSGEYEFEITGKHTGVYPVSVIAKILDQPNVPSYHGVVYVKVLTTDGTLTN